MFTTIYEREYSFYTKLAVAFEKLYDKHNVPTEDRLYITKFYGYKSLKLEETLVLENLAAKGFVDFDRMKTFDWEYASKSIEQMAKFHALGLALKEDNLEEFVRLCKTDIDISLNEDVTKSIVNQAFKNGTQVIKEEYRDRIRNFFETIDPLIGLKKLWSPCNTGSLIHSDYRPNNLMHRRRVSDEIWSVPCTIFTVFTLYIVHYTLHYFNKQTLAVDLKRETAHKTIGFCSL